jgi:hypothetical protein
VAFAAQSVESKVGVPFRPAALRFYPLQEGAVGLGFAAVALARKIE